MEKFTDYSKLIKVDMNGIVNKIMSIPEVKAELIRYNQLQLEQGIDSQDKRIQTLLAKEQGENLVYSLFTYGQKVQKGQDAQHVTLKDTGEFWQSMNVKVNENDVEILADFDKPDGNIMENFEAGMYDFLGLTPENLESFAIWVFQEYLEKELKSQLGLS